MLPGPIYLDRAAVGVLPLRAGAGGNARSPQPRSLAESLLRIYTAEKKRPLSLRRGQTARLVQQSFSHSLHYVDLDIFLASTPQGLLNRHCSCLLRVGTLVATHDVTHFFLGSSKTFAFGLGDVGGGGRFNPVIPHRFAAPVKL